MLSDSLLESVHNCIKCGLCLAACPIYRQLLEETSSPRGKVQLLKGLREGRLGPSHYLEEIASRCLLCHSCAAVCPSGMEVGHLIVGLRSEMAKSLGLEWKKRIAFRHLLSPGGFLGRAVQGARVLTSLLPPWVKIAGIPLSSLPPLPAVPLHRRYPERITPSHGRVKTSVAFFPGCMIDYIYPEIGSSLITLLLALGIEVIIPQDLACCGTPLFISGEEEILARNLEHNLEMIGPLPVEVVLTACASCGHSLRGEYPRLVREWGKDDALAKEVASKIEDISVFLQRQEGLDELLGPLPATLTYHDPCHLAKAEGIRAEPRHLLRSIPELNFIEMAEADACCGGGGSFQFYFPQTSQAIAYLKVKNIRQVGADIVATGCPACRFRLQTLLGSEGEKVRVLHTVQVLDEARGSSKR